MPIEDDIRALRRELASGRAQKDPAVRSAIVAELAARGEHVAGVPSVEKRATKKAAAPAKAKGE